MNPTTPILLGVNIDHVATLRQVRRATYPDTVEAVIAAEKGGADGITVHLREDRRHIQAHDIERILPILKTRLNLEMAVTDEMILYAEKIRPTYCCLVPEKREELTTEGGLNVLADEYKVTEAVRALQRAGIQVSLFIDPDEKQIEVAKRTGAEIIEIHTGSYADAENEEMIATEYARIVHGVNIAEKQGLIVNAGHGLNYKNVQAIAAIPIINELNIGHAIIARAIMTGLETAVREMRQLMREARLPMPFPHANL